MQIDSKSTALVLIDLQNGIVSRQLAPYSGAEVVQNSIKLAEKMRAAGGTVVYVHVDLSNLLQLPVEEPARIPNSPLPPASASEFVAELDIQPDDLIITKRQWGAFFGTDLEEQLRTRNIETIVLGGIATNFGVESTARAAAGLGFALIVVEDATTSMDADAHRFPYQWVFPRIGRVSSTGQIIEALGG